MVQLLFDTSIMRSELIKMQIDLDIETNPFLCVFSFSLILRPIYDPSRPPITTPRDSLLILRPPCISQKLVQLLFDTSIMRSEKIEMQIDLDI